MVPDRNEIIRKLQEGSMGVLDREQITANVLVCGWKLMLRVCDPSLGEISVPL